MEQAVVGIRSLFVFHGTTIRVASLCLVYINAEDSKYIAAMKTEHVRFDKTSILLTMISPPRISSRACVRYTIGYE